ncbi:uncharacterized protein B0H18DRAFT_507667 [Fomitopsis serialis]|uniref:uncharacterized protein n=1 Tax=Fomitopsis serialis TaxID=139415 RepID=UPI002008B8F1|nr:uncharacterized protein B0H18DRAFT_507667 [Neoantrodia serialis]KAH9922650.1 hypothetical protein B0H18DRAFT_507667 [Neoantrodia serialis]
MPMDSLNFDVVETILSYVESQDALKLATTCRTLHALAVQRLLSHISIDYNWSIDRILQYCTYMLADAKGRPRCLRSFSIISIPRGDLSVFDTLAEVLGHAPALRRVSLSWEAGYALDDSPAFADALASLDSLDLLDVCGVHLGLMRLLPRMKCRPRTVHCDLFPVSDSDYLEMSGLCKAEQSSPLCNFANCVTSLKLGHAAMLIEELVHTVWPCVRELSVSSSTIKNIQSISHAFPNLRTLRCWNVRLKDPVIPAEWRQLQFVSITDPIPLQCHVHHVQLNVDCERASMSYIHQSFEMLRCASPVTLGCYASVGLFRHVAEHLRSLRILHFDASNVPLDIPMHPTIVGRTVSCTQERYFPS